MEALLNSIELDPVASPIALLVIVLGARFLIGAVKTVIKVIMVLVILVGLYVFFYGGSFGGA